MENWPGREKTCRGCEGEGALITETETKEKDKEREGATVHTEYYTGRTLPQNHWLGEEEELTTTSFYEWQSTEFETSEIHATTKVVPDFWGEGG